jgi:diadenosine tetraphosphate (Ap4A) HIT family hydrolase
MGYKSRMTHPSFDAGCGVCNKLASSSPPPVFENELWQVRAIDAPAGVPGWMMLVARRHVAGPAQFDEREVRSFGPTWCHLQKVLLEVTGALRIYTAAMGESSPHFHGHLVPRFADMPKDARGWSVFDLERAAKAGEIVVDAEEVARLTGAFRSSLAASPPPAP